jgi:hypothetical protein
MELISNDNRRVNMADFNLRAMQKGLKHIQETCYQLLKETRGGYCDETSCPFQDKEGYCTLQQAFETEERPLNWRVD